MCVKGIAQPKAELLAEDWQGMTFIMSDRGILFFTASVSKDDRLFYLRPP